MLHTHEVTGSNPVRPTSPAQRGAFLFPHHSPPTGVPRKFPASIFVLIMPREHRPLVIVIITLVAGALALEMVNGRFWLNDFRVYYSAAAALMHGEQVYGIPFGEDTGFYKYAPIVALGFVPFALLPYTIAAILHFVLIGVALVLAFTRLEPLLMRHAFGTYPPRILLRGILCLLCIAVLFSRELHLGNINLWLVVGTILATEAALEGNDGLAGLLFGVLWLVKPYLAFMAVPLVVACRWQILRNAGIALAVGIFLPVVFLGPSSWLGLHRSWLTAMSAHSGYLHSPDTFASWAPSWFAWYAPMRHPDLIILMAGSAFTLLCLWQRRTTKNTDRSLMLQLWTAFALVPHLVITDQEHFLYSLPLIALVLGVLFQRKHPFGVVLFVFAMIGYATRSSDLWGAGMESRWVAAGALGAGNVLLVICAWALLRK